MYSTPAKATGRAIAMWSGPRNISTAMMRAWENRPDTRVIDEPFYAHYLHHTGIVHPMREQIIACGETDWQTVVHSLTQLPAQGIIYQKHITTHWLPHFTSDWLDALEHVFLIREPEPVIASYARKRDELNAADLGYEQQEWLFDFLESKQGKPPVVIDSRQFLEDPEGQLRSLCERLAIAFDESMLCWPEGARDSDGIWGEHWYDAVNRSTTFSPPRKHDVCLSDEQRQIAELCRPSYERLRSVAI